MFMFLLFQILEVAFMEYSRPTTDNAETETDPTPPDVSIIDPQPDVDVEPEPACPSPVKPSLVSKKLQVICQSHLIKMYYGIIVNNILYII